MDKRTQIRCFWRALAAFKGSKVVLKDIETCLYSEVFRTSKSLRALEDSEIQKSFEPSKVVKSLKTRLRSPPNHQKLQRSLKTCHETQKSSKFAKVAKRLKFFSRDSEVLRTLKSR